MNLDITKKTIYLLIIFSIVHTSVAFAKQVQELSSKHIDCAKVEGFSGDIELLDQKRNNLLTLEQYKAVPCGSWVLVRNGWIKLKHTNGFYATFSAGSFVQILDHVKNQKNDDHFLVFEGKGYFFVPQGSGPLVTSTASARMKMKSGRALLIYDQDKQSTQLSALEKKVYLTNKYDPDREIEVKAGEASSLMVEKDKVNLSMSKSIDSDSLKKELSDFHLDKEEFELALNSAFTRAKRTLASDLSVSKNDRALAGEKKTYQRHINQADDVKINDKWVKKVLGGEKIDEQLLYPTKVKKNNRKVNVVVSDVDSANEGGKASEKQEKVRLMESLSRISLD